MWKSATAPRGGNSPGMKETFAERKARKSGNGLHMIVLFYVIVAACGLSYFFFHLEEVLGLDRVGILVMIALVPLIVFFINRAFAPMDQLEEELFENLRISKRGIDGENIARPVILESLMPGDKVFFNKELPGGGDIDCIILGRKGLTIVEVKNNQNGLTLRQRFTKGFHDPRSEARRHAVRLIRYLKDRGFYHSIPSNRAVLHVNPNVKFSGKQGGVYNILGVEKFKGYYHGLPDRQLTDEVLREVEALIRELK